MQKIATMLTDTTWMLTLLLGAVAAVSLLVGVIGIALALVVSLVLVGVLPVPFVLNLGIVTLAFCFAAAVGVVFGYFPARRAAKLDPIDALRHE